MAKKRRTAKVPTPTWESPSLRLGKLEASNRWQVVGFFGLIGVVIVALALVGAAVFVRIWEESSRPGEIALKVGPATYKLGYYAKRLETLVAQSGGIQNPSTSADRMIQLMTDTLIEEQIALQFAEEQGLSVTEEDIDQELRSRFGLAQPVITGDGSEEEGAATPAPTVSLQSREERFRLRYQRQLEESRLTEKEFREMVKAQLLITRLRDKFAQEVPASAESVRYRQIVIRDVQTADEVIARLAAGEDFAALARQRSLDAATRQSGGEAAWTPRGALDPVLESVLFSLPVSGIQKATAQGSVYVVQLLEKAENRGIEESQKRTVANRAYQTWRDGKRQSLEIRNDVDLARGDAGKLEWLVKKVYG